MDHFVEMCHLFKPALLEFLLILVVWLPYWAVMA